MPQISLPNFAEQIKKIPSSHHKPKWFPKTIHARIPKVCVFKAKSGLHQTEVFLDLPRLKHLSLLRPNHKQLFPRNPNPTNPCPIQCDRDGYRFSFHWVRGLGAWKDGQLCGIQRAARQTKNTFLLLLLALNGPFLRLYVRARLWKLSTDGTRVWSGFCLEAN